MQKSSQNKIYTKIYRVFFFTFLGHAHTLTNYSRYCQIKIINIVSVPKFHMQYFLCFQYLLKKNYIKKSIETYTFQNVDSFQKAEWEKSFRSELFFRTTLCIIINTWLHMFNKSRFQLQSTGMVKEISTTSLIMQYINI